VRAAGRCEESPPDSTLTVPVAYAVVMAKAWARNRSLSPLNWPRTATVRHASVINRGDKLFFGKKGNGAMTDLALPGSIEPAVKRPNLDKGFNPLTMILFGGILAGGLLFVAYSLYEDVDATGTKITSYVPYLLLFVALLIALGFEFVNGFHDTANAVATVIYTHSLPAEAAVLWSGFFNFLGVALSSGAVAFGIISLLPVELILQVGSSAGFAMVFALLIAAIVWNLGTWWLGLPASSSHTMIGSIIGVGVANALLRGRDGTSGVDWGKATEIGEALLLSPIVGFVLSAVLLLIMKALIKNPALYESPKGNSPPPL
jgi:inorganic phosphate transporter, PiT family